MFKALLIVFLLFLSSSLPVTATELSVFAASSLSDAMTEVARRYEQHHPQDRILLNFAGSQTLAMQIEQGAPADLFISASHPVLNRLQERGLVTEIQPLLGNRLTLATRADLQPELKTLRDLGRPQLLLVIGNPQVPIGYYTRDFFSKLASSPAYGAALISKIEKNVVSEEGRVSAIIAKLLLGEADAGFVYQSDLAKSKLPSLPLPKDLTPQVVYPLAKVNAGTSHSERFYAFLLSSEAAAIFRRYGFQTGGER